MATSAQYAATVRNAYTQISTANTSRDGTGTTALLVEGGANGSRIDDIRIQAAGTTTAGVVRFFLSLDNGTTKRLIREVLVPAVTPSTTVEAWGVTLTDQAILLASASAELYVSTNNAETFNVAVLRGGDF